MRDGRENTVIPVCVAPSILLLFFYQVYKYSPGHRGIVHFLHISLPPCRAVPCVPYCTSRELREQDDCR